MKKISSVILAIAICFLIIPFSAFAQNIVAVNDYTDDEKNSVILKYTNNEPMLDVLFSNDTAIAYWSMINDTQENSFLKWSIDKASILLGEYQDKQDYAEILTNLIMMQSGDIAEQIQNQSQYDDLENDFDVMNVADIALDFVGGANLLEEFTPLMDAVTDGKDVIIDNVELAKYYETTIRDYTQSKLFLEAVSSYAENKELRDTASSLLKASDKLLESRLEYLKDSSAIVVNYQASFFIKNMSFELLKTVDLYKTDDIVKWYVDCGEKISNSISSIFSAGKFTFKMTMLAGNIGFGTSNTFNRYQEMKVVADIARAIVKANSQIVIQQNANIDAVLADIQTKCEYYKMLISTHARGEYLLHQLLVSDAGLLSDFKVLFDYFKEPGETTDSWYVGQINCMTYYYDILKKIFEVSDCSYAWIVEPTIEADDIFYLADYPDINHPINTLSKQADNSNAVIQCGNEYGIISLEGKMLTGIEYKEIANFGDSYMMISTEPKYSEIFDMDWNIFWLNKDGMINADVGNGDLSSSIYYYYEGVRQRTGFSNSDFVQEIIPVQQSSVYDLLEIKRVMDNTFGKYALDNNASLVTEFIYDECGSLSDGLFAVCENGKWGYVNEAGQVIISIEYDASWKQYPVFNMGTSRSTENVKDYCYAASDGFVVLCKENNWEVRDTNGNSIISSGIFEAIRPVFDGKCWVKKDGKWGVIQINAFAVGSGDEW